MDQPLVLLVLLVQPALAYYGGRLDYPLAEVVVVPEDALVPHGQVVLRADEGQEVLGLGVGVDVRGGDARDGVGVGDGLGFGGRAAGIYFGEDVEMLNVSSVAEPLLMLLHGRIEYYISNNAVTR